MAANDGTAQFNVGHPAPDRGRTSAASLLFGLGGAALAWSLQLIGTVSLAGAVCSAGDGPAGLSQAADGAQPTLMVINIAALAIAALAFYVAWSAYRSTPGDNEATHRTGGIMDAGEGRTRFLAIWGIWASALFICAIAFNTLDVFWVGLCAG